MNASPAYIRFSNIFLSEHAADFVNSCPRDDVELVVQDAIDSLLFKVIGDGDEASDFSPLLVDNVPVYATQSELESFSRHFSVTVVADFRNNGLQMSNRDGDYTEAYEIDACIYIASPDEMTVMLESWHRSSGNAPMFVN